MSTIRVTARDPERFRVEVEDGSVRTAHDVSVPGRLVEELGLSGVPRERIVQEAFVFLLEREPPTSILTEFGMEQISAYFPEFHEEIRTRLGA